MTKRSIFCAAILSFLATSAFAESESACFDRHTALLEEQLSVIQAETAPYHQAQLAGPKQACDHGRKYTAPALQKLVETASKMTEDVCADADTTKNLKFITNIFRTVQGQVDGFCK